jgi:hypothetical protein
MCALFPKANALSLSSGSSAGSDVLALLNEVKAELGTLSKQIDRNQEIDELKTKNTELEEELEKVREESRTARASEEEHKVKFETCEKLLGDQKALVFSQRKTNLGQLSTLNALKMFEVQDERANYNGQMFKLPGQYNTPEALVKFLVQNMTVILPSSSRDSHVGAPFGESDRKQFVAGQIAAALFKVNQEMRELFQQHQAGGSKVVLDSIREKTLKSVNDGHWWAQVTDRYKRVGHRQLRLRVGEVEVHQSLGDVEGHQPVLDSSGERGARLTVKLPYEGEPPAYVSLWLTADPISLCIDDLHNQTDRFEFGSEWRRSENSYPYYTDALVRELVHRLNP